MGRTAGRFARAEPRCLSGSWCSGCVSPFVRYAFNMPGRYSFQLPDLPGGCGPCVTRQRRTTSSERARARRVGGGGEHDAGEGVEDANPRAVAVALHELEGARGVVDERAVERQWRGYGSEEVVPVCQNHE